MYAYTIEGLGIGASNQIQLEFLPTTYMEMVGILPRYNTMKCQLQSMSGTLLGTCQLYTINVRYLTRYMSAIYNQCQVPY